MTVSEVRKRYLDFFAKRGHAVIPSAPIVPENDPTTLFTSSGMQPLVPYLLGEPHPKGNRLVDSQMSFRAQDIEEVGDNRHTTFFEMLGNWSLGDYFKKEQLPWVFEFLTSTEEGLGLDPTKLYVTVFDGDVDTGMDLDTEAVEVWKKNFAAKGIAAELVRIGSEEAGYEKGMQGGRIFSYGAKKNWWSRSGVPANMPPGEPGGPDSEIFYDFGTPHDPKWGKECHPNCDCGRFMEIGNSVFMEYIKNADGSFGKLPKQNVDFGGGLERLTAATRDNPDVFLIDVFDSARSVLESRSGKNYQGEALLQKSFRVILDHVRAASFILASGIKPSNTEQGYVLRRLIRRAIREADKLGIKDAVLTEVAEGFGAAYRNQYTFIYESASQIKEELAKEEAQFRKTLAQGQRELEKMGNNIDAFMLFTTYGFPIELTAEIAKERGLSIDQNAV
ncbi:MAG: alanine--tRNA ligase-related protein, partial [Candidatus Paceibacterota bacterium]